MRRERRKRKKQREAEQAASLAANTPPSVPQPKQKPAPASNPRAGRMPNAIELESIGGFKHADMMPILRETVKKEDVQRIRTNFKGHLLLELAPMSHQETMTLWREVSAALDGKAKCRPRTPSVRVNCTNIPPGTSSEEISLEMSAALGVEIFSDQITTVKTHYGTLVAFFDCPAIAVTNQALARQYTVGFSKCCRLRLLERRRQCYRCYEYGHTAARCRGKDRSSKCHRCAEDKHEGPCTRERKCLGCEGPDAIGHSLGQRSCRQIQRSTIRQAYFPSQSN